MEATFKPSKKQYLAWEYLTDTITTEVGYGGAASGGKSYLGCVWITSMSLAYPETASLIGRKELTNLKRTTLITLFKVFKEFGITEKDYSYNQQNNTITFSNGSIIFLLDLGYKPSDPLYTRLGGLELTRAFIDESNEVPAEAKTILKTRLGRKGDLLPKMLETFNPDKGDVYYRYYKPWKENALPEYRKFIQALPGDNEYTTKDYIEQLRRSDTVTRERLLFGNFEYDDDPHKIINYNAILDLFTNTVDNTNRWYISADIARFGKDKSVFGVWNGLLLVKVEVYNGISTTDSANIIRGLASEYRVPFSQIIIDEDGIGGGVRDQLGQSVRGFIAQTPAFPIWDTHTHRLIPANFKNLRSQCYFKLAELVNNHEISVQLDDNKIKESMVEELDAIKKDPVAEKITIISKDDIKAIIGRSPDLSDMLMMRMYFEIETKRDDTQRQQRIYQNRLKTSKNYAR